MSRRIVTLRRGLHVYTETMHKIIPRREYQAKCSSLSIPRGKYFQFHPVTIMPPQINK
jgi:hypothetical protein